MIHEVLAHHAAVIRESVGERRRRGVEQNARASDGRCAQEHHLGAVLARSVRRRIDHAHPRHTPALLVVDDRVDERIRQHGQPPRRHRGWKGGRLRGEVGSGGATALAWAAAMACRSPLVIASENRRPADRHVPLGKAALDALLHVLLRRVHLHRRLELAVRQVLQPESFAAHPDVPLHVAVPRRDVGVPDWPVHAVAVTQVRLEVQIAPAVHLAAPRQRLAANLIPLDPGEWLGLLVRMLAIVHEEVFRGLAKLACARLHLILVRAVLVG